MAVERSTLKARTRKRRATFAQATSSTSTKSTTRAGTASAVPSPSRSISTHVRAVSPAPDGATTPASRWPRTSPASSERTLSTLAPSRRRPMAVT